jgi:predicted ATP-grasp superfamily ATP-dependent carboligase
VTALLAELSYRGLVDLDLRRDARDGQYKLLDFNPRLGAQFRLFRNQDGLDVVLAAYLDLTGQAVPEGTQLNGRRFLVENYDPLAALRYWRDGELRPGSWLASLRSVDELAWFARDDLRPFGLMCTRMAARAITRRFRRPDRPGAPGGKPRYLAGRAHGHPADPGPPAAAPGELPVMDNSPHIQGTAGAVSATRGEPV